MKRMVTLLGMTLVVSAVLISGCGKKVEKAPDFTKGVKTPMGDTLKTQTYDGKTCVCCGKEGSDMLRLGKNAKGEEIFRHNSPACTKLWLDKVGKENMWGLN